MINNKNTFQNTEILTNESMIRNNYMCLEILTDLLENSEENGFFNPKKSHKYNSINKNNKKYVIILKQLLEANLEQTIYPSSIEKHICTDQKIYESPKINLRYLGFKRPYYMSKDDINDENMSYSIYRIYINNDKECLCLWRMVLYVFEVLDNSIDNKYIFFSTFSNTFYETNEYIKLDYMPINEIELQLYINAITKNFYFLDNQNNRFSHDKYFQIIDSRIYICNIECSYIKNKNIFIKGIQKKN